MGAARRPAEDEHRGVDDAAMTRTPRAADLARRTESAGETTEGEAAVMLRPLTRQIGVTKGSGPFG